VLVALSFGTGMLDVLCTKTVGIEEQDAKREVFESTNSFTKAKRQEAIKYYKEYLGAETDEEKKAIEVTVRMSLADFDEDTYITDAVLLSWIKDMKY
jgi:hypothetical protein